LLKKYKKIVQYFLRGLSVLQDQLPNEIVFPAQVVHAGFRVTPEKESPYVLKLRRNSGGGDHAY
jgi:hypothetical protein